MVWGLKCRGLASTQTDHPIAPCFLWSRDNHVLNHRNQGIKCPKRACFISPWVSASFVLKSLIRRCRSETRFWGELVIWNRYFAHFGVCILWIVFDLELCKKQPSSEGGCVDPWGCIWACSTATSGGLHCLKRSRWFSRRSRMCAGEGGGGRVISCLGVSASKVGNVLRAALPEGLRVYSSTWNEQQLVLLPPRALCS